MIEQFQTAILNGYKITFEEAVLIADYYGNDEGKLQTLLNFCQKLREFHHQKKLDLCSIVNAKSGNCSEDCKFCSQSSHNSAEVDRYEIVEHDFAVELASCNEQLGVGRFSLVTAGRAITPGQLEKLQPVYESIKRRSKLQLCASMGMLSAKTAGMLKDMGVGRYHCNLETSKSYFKKVCTTHSWQEKVETIRCAQNAGMEVCSGGIIGLGESRVQRLELAFELAGLNIKSIPINILNPIKNTAFENVKPLSLSEILLSFAMFVLVNPKAVIRVAGGRNLLGDAQEKLFLSGVSGAIVGDYLTTSGNGLKNDLAMFKKLGFEIKRF